MAISFLFLFLFGYQAIAQYLYDPLGGYHCYNNLEQYLISPVKNPSTFGGAYKPERTNQYPGTNEKSVFRVLMVFVRFTGDTIEVHNPNWDTSGGPSYMNKLLAWNRVNSTDWWNSYDEDLQRVSDYWA